MISCFLTLMLVGAISTPEYAVIFAEHPRLLFTKADLVDIRQRIEQQEGARRVYNSIKGNADAWLTREAQLPDRGGQWWHWYSCKEDGATLRTKSDTEHECPVCGKVYTGYPYDDVVLDRKHNQLAEAIWDCGLVYQITGEKQYAEAGKRILLAYAETYLSYPLHNIHGDAKVGGGRVGPQTLDESTWLIKMAQGADMIWETLADTEVQQVSEGLFRPAAVEVIQKHRMGIHNIQCWKNSAVGLTGFLLGDTDLVWDAIESDHGYRKQMEHGVRPGGPWFEGAWGYHFYTLNALWNLTEAAHHNRIDLYGPELRSMFDAPIDFAMPNLHLPAFNDSGEVDVSRSGALYEIAHTRYGDAKYRAALSSRSSKQAMLYGVEFADALVQDAQHSRNYEEAGYAILTQGEGRDATWLCVDYGPHGGGHGHPDKLNFVLYSQGQVVAPDPGTARYGVPIQREWYRQTLAHNTLTVDEQSQNPTEGRCLFFNETMNAAVFQAGGIYEGVTFYRTALLLDEDTVVLLDQVRSDKPHVFDFAYHNIGKWTETPNGAAWPVPDKGGYMHLRDAMSTTVDDSAEFTLVLNENSEMALMALTDAQTEFIWGTGVGRNTADRVPMVIARQQGEQANVIWVISLSGEFPGLEWVDLSSSAPALALRIRSGDESTVWIANPERASVEFGGKEWSDLLIRIAGE